MIMQPISMCHLQSALKLPGPEMFLHSCSRPAVNPVNVSQDSNSDSLSLEAITLDQISPGHQNLKLASATVAETCHSRAASCNHFIKFACSINPRFQTPPSLSELKPWGGTNPIVAYR